MNEGMANNFLKEISNNLTITSSNTLKLKPLIVALKLAQKEIEGQSEFDCSVSAVIEIAEEKLNECINGCLNTSVILNNESDIPECYKKKILNPLNGVMAILIVIQDSLKPDILWLESKKDKIDKAECIAGINSNIQTANLIWDLLNEQISEPLYDDFRKLEKFIDEELELATN